MTDTTSYDTIIVGGGPAGMSAAQVLGRFRLRVLVIDAGQQRNLPAAGAHGFLTRDGTPPSDLIKIGREEMARYGVELVQGRVTTASAGQDPNDPVSVTTDDGQSFQGRRLLITTGLVDDLPDIPGVADLWGSDVIACPFCHGYEARDRKTVLWVHDAFELHKAKMIRRLTDDLTILADLTDGIPDDDPVVQDLINSGVRLIQGTPTALAQQDGRLTGIHLSGGDVVPAEVLYLATQLKMQDDLLRQVGAELTPFTMGPVPMGDIAKVDAMQSTSVPGVYAAGNAVDPMAQIVHAASAGYRAAQAIMMSLG